MLFVAKFFATIFFAIRFCTYEVQFLPNFAPIKCNFNQFLHPQGAKSIILRLLSYALCLFPFKNFLPTFPLFSLLFGIYLKQYLK